jgi:RNA polymerase sigma factor (sigma-70 family)
MSVLPRHLLSDEPLARLAAAGDRPAFDVLFARYRGALLRCSRSIVRNDHDAQDVVQNTALKALSGLGRRREGVPFRPWLFRIAYNEAISVLRGRRARPTAELEVSVAHPEPGPAQQVLQRADLRALLDDIAELTEGQRTALLLRQINGSSYEEIARVLDTTPIAARRSVSTARGNLVAFAQGRDGGCAAIQLTLAAGDRRAMRARGVRAHLRSCPVCRAHAQRPGRAARAAALVPVPVWELLGTLRAALAPAGAGLTDGFGAPVTKALAVAAAVTAGVGSLPFHGHATTPSSGERAAVTHRAASRVHHRTHKTATPAVHHAVAPAIAPAARPVIAPAPVTHHAVVAHRAAASSHHAAVTHHVTHAVSSTHHSFAAHTDTSSSVPVAHHVVPRHDAVTGAPSRDPEGAPASAPPQTGDDGGSPPTGQGPGQGQGQDQGSQDPPSGGGSATPPAAPSNGHMDSSQLGPHNGPPGPSV